MMASLQFAFYKIFIAENRHDIAGTARRIGVSSSLIYKWCEGLSSPSISQCIQLYFATDDREFLDVLIVETGFALVKKAPAGSLSGKDIQTELLENHDSLSRINIELSKALEDDRLTKREIKTLLVSAEKNRQQAREVYAVIEALLQ